MSSSSADFQPNRVCRFRGLTPSGKSTSAPIVGCANQYMSYVMSDGSRVLVEPNEWCGTTHRRQDIRPQRGSCGESSRREGMLLAILPKSVPVVRHMSHLNRPQRA